MTRNNLQTLHAAIKQVLRQAHAMRPRSTASAIALLTLSAAVLSPHAGAADYSAANETELRDAIDDANADADASATITLTGNVTLASTTAFPALTKPITLNTNGFQLNGQSGVVSGSGYTFSGNTLTVTGTGALRGGDSSSISNTNGGIAGSIALTMTNGSVTNSASVVGGRGADNTVGPGGAGSTAVSVSDGALINTGTIVGGRGGDKLSGSIGGGGPGGEGVSLTNGALTNNGTITGGQGGVTASGIGTPGQGGAGATLSGGNHVNNGTIRGGQAGATGPGSAVGGSAVRLTNVVFTNNTGALLDGGTGPSPGGALTLFASNTLINHGTISGQISHTTINGTSTITNTGTIEGKSGQRAILGATFGGAVTNITVVNSGTLRAGAGQTNAILFGTHANAISILELQPGSVIEGNVVAGSTNVNDTFRLGGSGADTLDVSGIGSKYTGFAVYEKTGTSTWTLTGTTSAVTPWTLLGGTLSISSNGSLGSTSGTLLTFDGGTLRNTASFTANRHATLNAGGGTFQADVDLLWTGNLTGSGTLTKIGSGTLTLTGNNNPGGGTTIAAGTLKIGNGGTLGTLAGNINNNGILAFNRTLSFTTPLSIDGVISGSGSVTQLTGTTVLTGNNTYTGATNINAGTLRINGDQSAATGLVTVANGATLGGSGIIGGAVNVADGGHLAPGNSPGTLTMGTLTLSAGSILDFELGEANAVGSTLNDLINVNGDLTLDGTLNVSLSSGGTYGAGIYRLINYTGALTDNGLDLGLMPAPSSNYVQTSVANQINLINTQGLLLNYWDSAPNPRNDGQIGGGAGLWQAGGNDNWTTADGAINADYQDGAMAVFGGTAGTVTVDDSLGAINVSGLQFATDGYRLEGDAIGLNAGLNTVRVGDGTDAGASYTATIASALNGTGTLDKADLGTLVLTGANDYTGGTTISAGTLQLGDGGTSGSLTGDVTNNGILAFNRSDALSIDGVISGTGALRQTGTGTTTLTGAGSNTSTLDIQHGTLEVASGASLAAINTIVAAGTTLRNGGTFSGTAGDNIFALGGTLIGRVDLLDGNDQVQIATGADFSQATFEGGAGVDTLDLTHSSAHTLPHTLGTGFEHLVKHGAGTLTLAGTVDGFSDSIAVSEGGLQLSGANVITNELRVESGARVTGTGSLSGGLTNTGTLSPGNSPGVIHIAGSYSQAASGTLISEITRAGTDLLDVAGTASLGGTHQINVEYGLYLDGTTHTVIQADGGISGEFSSVEMNTSALMTAERELSANTLAVSFARQPMTSVVDAESGRGRLAAWLEEQINAGSVTPTMNDYIDSLLQQPTAEGAKALLGERAEPVASVSQNSVSMLGAGFARTVFERFTLSDTAQCAPTQQGSSDALNCFWGHGLRQWGQAGGDSRYDWTSDGMQIGVDRALSSGWSLGGTFAYADTGVRDLNSAHSDVRSKMGGLYTNYDAGRLSVGTMAFYSDNDNETRRSVLVGSIQQQARADFDSDSYGAGIRLSYRVTSEAAPLVRPFIEAFYDHIGATRFSERHAGEGNMSGRVHERDGLRGTLGLQLADSFEGYGQLFRPALELGITHQFEDVRSTLDLQPFSGMSPFRTYGPALDRTAYIGRASLNVSLGANASIALGYGGEIAEDYSQHEGNLSFRVAW